MSRDGSGRTWENLRSGGPDGISWDFVHAFAFDGDEIWYGTIGNGWGLSRDGGRTWRNWTFDELGPRWLYLAPEGLAAAEDAVWIATADGLRITADDGETWRDITETAPEAGGLASRYLIGLSVGELPEEKPAESVVFVRHLAGAQMSRDGGRTWTRAAKKPPRPRPRSVLLDAIRRHRATFRSYTLSEAPAGADPVGRAVPGTRDHFWFRRPIGRGGNLHIDQTYTYGSTMGGNFQEHQGIEFNNPEGTPVLAAGDGVVAYAGLAEAGSKTIAILHDRSLDGARLWSTYYHNSNLTAGAGERVRAGDVIAHVGSTGRSTNDHLHLEIHFTPGDDVGSVIDPEERYPPFSRNPQLWIEPLPGTGVIAGRVTGPEGRAVRGTRVYGVVKPEPRETPFSFAEIYAGRAHPDPVFNENFVIGDVPAGEYVLGAEVEQRRVFRAVSVAAGRVTEVDL